MSTDRSQCIIETLLQHGNFVWYRYKSISTVHVYKSLHLHRLLVRRLTGEGFAPSWLVRVDGNEHSQLDSASKCQKGASSARDMKSASPISNAHDLQNDYSGEADDSAKKPHLEAHFCSSHP